MGVLTRDEALFPIVLNKGTSVTDQDLEDSITGLEAVASRARLEGKYFVSITLEGDSLGATQRKTFAARVAKADPVLAERLVVSIIIITNPVKRGALTALLWLVGQKPETRVCGDARVALEIAERALAAKGQHVPPECTPEYVAAFDRKIVAA